MAKRKRKSTAGRGRQRRRSRAQDRMPAGLVTLFLGLILMALAFVPGSAVWKTLHDALFGVFGCGSFVVGAALCFWIAKALGREFNIMAHDVGRSIQIVAHLFQDIDIVEDAEAVLRSLMPIDKEVTTVDGKNYTLRIAPYRTTENSIEGLVLTIIDSIGEK